MGDFEGKSRMMNKLQNVSEDMGMMEMVREYYCSYMTEADLKNIKASEGAVDAPRPDPLLREKFRVIQETQTCFERLDRYDRLADQYNDLLEKMKEKDSAYKKLINKYELLVQDFMNLMKNPNKRESSMVDYNVSPHKHSANKRYSPNRSPQVEIPRHRNQHRAGPIDDSFEIDRQRDGRPRNTERNSPGVFIEEISEIDRKIDHPLESSIEGVNEFVGRNDRVRNQYDQQNGVYTANQHNGRVQNTENIPASDIRQGIGQYGVERTNPSNTVPPPQQSQTKVNYNQAPPPQNQPISPPILQPPQPPQPQPPSPTPPQNDLPKTISKQPPPLQPQQDPPKPSIIQPPTTPPPPPPQKSQPPTPPAEPLQPKPVESTPGNPPQLKQTAPPPPPPPVVKTGNMPQSKDSSYSLGSPSQKSALGGEAEKKGPGTVIPPPVVKNEQKNATGNPPPNPPAVIGQAGNGSNKNVPLSPPVNKIVPPPAPPMKSGSGSDIASAKSSPEAKKPATSLPPPPPAPVANNGGATSTGKNTPPAPPGPLLPPGPQNLLQAKPGILPPPPPPLLDVKQAGGGKVAPPPPPPPKPANISNSYFTESSKEKDSYDFGSNNQSKVKAEADDSYEFGSNNVSKKSEKGNSFLSASKPGDKSSPPKEDQSKNSYFVDEDDDYLN